MIKRESKKTRLNLGWVAVVVMALIVSYSSFCRGDYLVFEDNFDDGVIAPEWSTYYSTVGSFAETSGTMQITADGTDMWVGNDEYGAVYTSATGDFNVLVKVEYQDYTHEWAKAGIAVKNDMSQPGSSLGYVFILVTPVKYAFHWDTGAGMTIDELRNNPNYPDDPDGSETITSFEGPVNWMDHYGQRISGFVQPPQNGDYRFWIASDGNSELWLSTDDDPANVVLIAEVPGWTGHQEWWKYPEQKSSWIWLVAGQQYYVEALHKESDWRDNLAVAWKKKGGGSQQVIQGDFLREWWTTGWTGNGFLDSSTDTDFVTSVYPSWLRLEKCGTTFTGYYSTTGPSGPWISVGSATAENANVVQDVGMAVTSHESGVLGTAIFDDFILYDTISWSIKQLVDDVAAINLQQGIENSLDVKLDAVSKALDDLNENNDIAAINALQAFINAIEAQRGKKITNEQADELIAAAQEIIDLLMAE